MANMEGFLFTATHEWLHQIDTDIFQLGITDFAQSSMGDIVFVNFPEVGDHFSSGDSFMDIESVKSASDLYLPVNGEIIEVNGALEEQPELLNQAAYDTPIVTVKVTGNLPPLMNESDYLAYLEREELL